MSRSSTASPTLNPNPARRSASANSKLVNSTERSSRLNRTDLVMSSEANKGGMACFRIASEGSISNFHLEVESEESILLSEQLLCLKF